MSSNIRTIVIIVALIPALLAPLIYFLLRSPSTSGHTGIVVGIGMIVLSIVALFFAGVMIGRRWKQIS